MLPGELARLIYMFLNGHHFKGGKYKSCEEIFEEEYADEYSDSENDISGSSGAGMKRL